MKKNLRVVIAGFGPFPGAPCNPSAALAQALACSRRPTLSALTRTAHVFATAYAAVDRDLDKLFAAKPDAVLMFGLAARRRHVCVETRARNAVSVLFPDVYGCRPKANAIAAKAPSWQRGNAPFVRLVNAMQTTGVAARLSRDAGRYLCNYAYWQALQRARTGTLLIAFVHIPLLRRAQRKAKRRALSRQQLTRAGEAILIALAAAHRPITGHPSS